MNKIFVWRVISVLIASIAVAVYAAKDTDGIRKNPRRLQRTESVNLLLAIERASMMEKVLAIKKQIANNKKNNDDLVARLERMKVTVPTVTVSVVPEDDEPQTVNMDSEAENK